MATPGASVSRGALPCASCPTAAPHPTPGSVWTSVFLFPYLLKCVRYPHKVGLGSAQCIPGRDMAVARWAPRTVAPFEAAQCDEQAVLV